MSTQELFKQLAQHSDGLSTPPNSPGFSFSLGEMSKQDCSASENGGRVAAGGGGAATEQEQLAELDSLD